MVYQLTKFHVQRVDMVINPPWNLPFLGAKGLTSPEQTATGKGISNPFMAVMVCQKPYGIQLTNVSSTETLKNSCCKDKKRRLEVLQIKNNLKNSIYNILRKLKVFKVKIKNVLKELEVHNLSRDSEKEESLDHKQTHFYKMSQPANDEFSQHLSDEESNHEDASDTGAAPKQQQQMIPQTTAISNIKLPILKKEEYPNS
ncbi:hypothetical protein Tco_0199435 [Tanacetum coccineum]